MQVAILTSRMIGERCRLWATENLPDGAVLTDSIKEAGVIISVLYARILKPYEIEGKRVYNFHPSILPEYRGSATYSWAIYNGEKEAGVTLHEIDPGVDTGPIISIEKFPIGDSDTAGDVFRKAEAVIFSMFKHWFASLVSGAVVSSPQESCGAKEYKKRDLDRLKDVTRLVRALTFPGKESAYYFNKKGEKVYLEYE